MAEPARVGNPGTTIGQRLVLLVLGVAIPLLLLSAVIVQQFAARERRIQREDITYAARAIRDAVDARLGVYVATARVLAGSADLRYDDVASFAETAAQVPRDLPGVRVVLTDAAGHQLYNSASAPGMILPAVSPETRRLIERAGERHAVQVSNVYTGRNTHLPVVSLAVPAFREGQPRYFVLLILSPDIFLQLLTSQGIPKGWLAGIADAGGNFVARSQDHQRLVGAPISQGWRATLHEEGWAEFDSIEGDRLYNANAISTVAGWAVGLAARRAVAEAPVRRIVLWGSLAGGAVTLVCLLLAMAAARSITRPVKVLEGAAHALEHHRLGDIEDTGLPEADRVLGAFRAASKALLQQERNLRAAKAEAERAAQAKTHFLAAASHDLRQPFQGLRFLIDLLNQQLTEPRFVQVVEAASSALARGEKLLRALLDLSKLDAGAVHPQRCVFPLFEVVDQAGAEFRQVARAKGLRLVVVATSLRVDSDPVLLARILRNLVDNAVRYTARGGVLIGCRRSGGTVRIEVWDSGEGIPAEQQERIFEEFFQIGNPGRSPEKGLGIGLPVARRTAALLGHAVAVHSRPGRGSVFSVTVPLG